MKIPMIWQWQWHGNSWKPTPLIEDANAWKTTNLSPGWNCCDQGAFQKGIASQSVVSVHTTTGLATSSTVEIWRVVSLNWFHKPQINRQINITYLLNYQYTGIPFFPKHVGSRFCWSHFTRHFTSAFGEHPLSTTTIDQHTSPVSGWNMFGINCNMMQYVWNQLQPLHGFLLNGFFRVASPTA